MGNKMAAQDGTQRLIAKAQGGDRTTFTELIQQYQESLMVFIKSRLGSHIRKSIDAEDVIQETTLRAFNRLEHFHWQGPDSFSRWLHRIALNVIREIAKREKRVVIVPRSGDVPADSITQGTLMRRNERFDRLQKALDDLSPDHRQVILLARVDRLPIKEVARRMQRSPEAVTQLLWRAMQQLKTSFGTTDSFHLPQRRLESDGAQNGE